MSLTQQTLKLALPMAISLVLAACGGGGSSGSSSSTHGFGSNSTDTTESTDTTTTTDETETTTEEELASSPEETAVVASLVVYPSSRSLLSDADADDSTDGSNPVIIYAMAKDSNNLAMTGVTFTPSVSEGATIFPGNDDGFLTTWRLVPDEPRNQTVEVSVTAGGITETMNIDIIGTEIQIDGPENISMDKPTTYTIKLKDAAGKGLASQPVTINSSLLTKSLITDTEGEAQFDIQPTSGGSYTINASALGSNENKSIMVSPNAFNLSSSSSSELSVGQPSATKPAHEVQLNWTANGTPQAGKVIHLSATRGKISKNGTETGQITTDANGMARFNIESDTAGATVITATDNTTYLSTSLTLEFIATEPHTLNIQADPSLIAALGTSTILAQVKDESDNPVKNQVVVFNLNDTVDGTLSSSKAQTDSSGQASVVYNAGKSTSAKDGVVITSHIEGAPNVPSDTTTLTVGGKAVRIVFGFDELIEEDAPFYDKTFGVIVTDNAGNPVAGKKIDFTVIPTHYRKGHLEYYPLASQWGIGIYRDADGNSILDNQGNTIPALKECISEDADKDGSLDSAEDINNNGSLEPTNSTTISGDAITDASGQAKVKISYPQNHAWWERIELTAQVTVDGTEYIQRTNMLLPVLAADMTKESSPPNRISPYGDYTGANACQLPM